jgi:indolepyruvate ferredoxin oxidoreductase beta subunit
MKRDIILAGVGGQGVLSIAAIIARAAVAAGLNVRQSEVHGMAQRGGAVLAHLRLSDGPIAGDLVPRGGADLILAMEPVESLRYTAWLAPSGALVTAAEPFRNIPDYPALEGIYGAIEAWPNGRVVAAEALAKKAGLARAVNMVMVGAASPFLPVDADELEATICEIFAGKAADVVAANRAAFRLGREAASGRGAAE